MSKYLVKRVLLAILSILIVSAITFFVMNLIPGGPFNKEKATSKEAQQVLEERYNLDTAGARQQGDNGTSRFRNSMYCI